MKAVHQKGMAEKQNVASSQTWSTSRKTIELVMIQITYCSDLPQGFYKELNQYHKEILPHSYQAGLSSCPFCSYTHCNAYFFKLTQHRIWQILFKFSMFILQHI